MPAPVYDDRTLAELALRKIGALDFGQDVPAEQMQVATDKIPGLLDDMSLRGIYQAGDTSEIVIAAWDHVGSKLAYRLRDEFGLSGEALMRAMKADADATLALREIATQKPPFAPVQAPFY